MSYCGWPHPSPCTPVLWKPAWGRKPYLPSQVDLRWGFGGGACHPCPLTRCFGSGRVSALRISTCQSGQQGRQSAASASRWLWLCLRGPLSPRLSSGNRDHTSPARLGVETGCPCGCTGFQETWAGPCPHPALTSGILTGRVRKGNRGTLSVPELFWRLLSCRLQVTWTHGKAWARPCHRSLGQLWFCFWSWFLSRCNSYIV